MKVNQMEEVNQVTLVCFDPFDSEHRTHTMLVSGRSGSGKSVNAIARGGSPPYALNPWDVPDPARVRTGSAPVDDRGGAS
jgi:hypothetical protein